MGLHYGSTVGTSQFTIEDGVKWSLIGICIVCCIFVIIVTLMIYAELWAVIGNAKTNAQKRKIKLWNYSWMFVCCLLLLTLVILVFSFTIQYYNIGDALCDVIIAFAIMIHFWQWRENVHVFVDRRFLQPLRTANYKERNVFQSRIEDLAKRIHKNCEDQKTAVEIVKMGQDKEEEVFTNRVKLSDQAEKSFKRHMFRAMVYKVGQVSMGVGYRCCHRSF